MRLVDNKTHKTRAGLLAFTHDTLPDDDDDDDAVAGRADATATADANDAAAADWQRATETELGQTYRGYIQ